MRASVPEVRCECLVDEALRENRLGLEIAAPADERSAGEQQDDAGAQCCAALSGPGPRKPRFRFDHRGFRSSSTIVKPLPASATPTRRSSGSEVPPCGSSPVSPPPGRTFGTLTAQAARSPVGNSSTATRLVYF